MKQLPVAPLTPILHNSPDKEESGYCISLNFELTLK